MIPSSQPASYVVPVNLVNLVENFSRDIFFRNRSPKRLQELVLDTPKTKKTMFRKFIQKFSEVIVWP